MENKNDIKSLDDTILVRKIVSDNDIQLFSVLYDRYAGLVYNRCMMFVRSKVEAEDLTHDIFIKLFVKLRTFKGNSKFSSWLYSFVYNHCVNYITRDKHKKNEVALESEALQNIENEGEYSDEDLFRLKSDKLAKALKMINPEQKKILLLKYQDDFTIKELQEVLQIGESAVKMRLKRAKAKLVELYNEL